MDAEVIFVLLKKMHEITYKIFVSDGISGMAVSCNLMQRTNLSVHVHPTGHSLADDDEISHNKCSTSTYNNIIFDVMFLVGMHILIICIALYIKVTI